MIQILIYAMVYLGSALMVYNIFCFIQFVRYIREMKVWDGKSSFLYVPIFLLVFFVAAMLAQFIGGARLFQSVTGHSYHVGLALFGLLVVLYTSIGGFRAVVLTDALQGVVMLVAEVAQVI